MTSLADMPQIVINAVDLAQFGEKWRENNESLSRTPPFSSGQLGKLFDTAVGRALSMMLGGVAVVEVRSPTLLPPHPDCVEVGPVRIIGGVRPQNFDVGYRPDGVRFVFDSKTLNDTKSVGKNWQNMVNDLATEATTIHSRFPYALVTFMVIVPVPCLSSARRRAIIETLERLAQRSSVADPPYMAEVIAFVAWNPKTGEVDASIPAPSSMLRLERFSERVQTLYYDRYKGLPPHALDEDQASV